MIWLIVEEADYLNDIEHLNLRIRALDLKIENLNADNTLFLPNIDQINTSIKSPSPKIIIEYRTPKEVLGEQYNVFTLIYIKSDDFPFTDEHKRLEIPKSVVLSERLGLRIVTPSVTFDDMAGASVLHEDMNKMLNLEDMDIMHITGLFLFGVAGAGKSYFAECFAGTTGRHFVMLDLAHFMSLPNPTKAIDDVFVFLLSQKESYLLLIDEIEKMFQLDGGSTNLVSEQIFGKMLTWLANIYESKNSNLTFVATANRVENLLKNKPEFVRRGRFDRLYFLNYPKVKTSAPEIFEMYLNKERKNIIKALKNQFELYRNNNTIKSKKLIYIFKELIKESIEIDTFINVIIDNKEMDIPRIIQVIEGMIGKDKITDAQYFIYSPPEIKSLVKEILQSYVEDVTHRLHSQVVPIGALLTDEIVLKPISIVLEDIVFKTPPLQITAPDGIGFQLAQAKNIKQGDRIAPFTEIS